MRQESPQLITVSVFALFFAVADLLLPHAPAEETPAASTQVQFEKEVLPILKQNCFECHHQDAREGGLRFFGQQDLLQLNDSGLAAITPGKPEESELIRRVSSDDELERMPPEGKGLSKAQIETLQKWIRSGAEWPAEFTVTESHWSYELPQRAELPKVEHKS